MGEPVNIPRDVNGFRIQIEKVTKKFWNTETKQNETKTAYAIYAQPLPSSGYFYTAYTNLSDAETVFERMLDRFDEMTYRVNFLSDLNPGKVVDKLER